MRAMVKSSWLATICEWLLRLAMSFAFPLRTATIVTEK
jgi:hypothetical protein